MWACSAMSARASEREIIFNAPTLAGLHARSESNSKSGALRALPDFSTGCFPWAHSTHTVQPMISLKLLAFAQTADRLGWREMAAECEPQETPRAIISLVAPDFEPGNVRVAVNCEYHSWDEAVGPNACELALLPPVSGG